MILKVIINSAHHLENVVNDALDISRIENGQFEPIFDFFDIREALDEVLEIMQFQVTAKNLTLKRSVDSKVP